ncbi:unnamed protein product [Candidula unifasciata]|uniref:Uncharacterized protein n=1 Tax=Candidula unifasciata TaxID=100452 RepID=A0A8S3ZLS1_9EUPU|nr:unnamed protein product [Candidula unifasciata]
MMGIPVVVIAFAFLAGCQALPLNESYDCLTDDACEKINTTTRYNINNKLYCCQRGDGIRFTSSQFTFYSSGGQTSNVTSDQSVDTTDVNKQEGPAGGKIQRKSSSNTTCKCGAVDQKKLDEEMSKYYQEMSEHMRQLFGWFWPF